MSKLPSTFKRKDHGEMNDSSVAPAGKYTAKITESDYVKNKNKNGHILKLTFEIQDKEYKGKKAYVNLNLDNPNEQSVEIANGELATICDAVGKASIKDTKQLHGIPISIELIVVPAEGKWREKNEIVMYDPISSGSKDDDPEEDPEDDPENDTTTKEIDDDEIDSDMVKEKARDYKKENGMKELKNILGEYGIEKISGIGELSEDDLEALNEDLDDGL